MIYLVSNVRPGPNNSVAPSGLLEFIAETLETSLVVGPELHVADKAGSTIVIYGRVPKKSSIEKTISKGFRKRILIGPDAHYLNHLTLVEYFNLPGFLTAWVNAVLKKFQKTLVKSFDIVFVVGKRDYEFIKDSGYQGEVFYLPHPYLSSLRNSYPVMATGRLKKVVIIGKSYGLPVGFKKFKPEVVLQCYEFLKNRGYSLEIFSSTGLDLSMVPDHAVKKAKDPLPNEYFADSVVINLATVGAGTANRTLSALHDGAVICSNDFGLRNIQVENWGHRVMRNPYKVFTDAWLNLLIEKIQQYNATSDKNLGDFDLVLARNGVVKRLLRDRILDV